MFDPIQNGTIFDVIMAVFMGITLGASLMLVYVVIVQAFGYDPLEKGVVSKMVKDGIAKILRVFRK